MSTYKIIISYQGFDFYGWQKQHESQPTIQSVLEDALKKIQKSDKLSTLASGRTDRRVHAREQVIKVQLDLFLEPDALKRALNSLLPNQIRVLVVDLCSSSFHPISDAVAKEYVYLFKNNPSPFIREMVCAYHPVVNIDLLEKACKILIGRHDFKAYMCTGTPVKSTIREIFSCSLKREDSFLVGDLAFNDIYIFRIKGEGFLKQMVRQLMGTLWKINENKVSLASFESSLSTEWSEENKRRLGVTAPGHGLYLWKVDY